MVDAAQGLLLADERRHVVHAGALAGADQGQAQRVHHLPHAVAFLLDPAVYDPLGIFQREIVDRGQYAAQFAQDFGVLPLPVFRFILSSDIFSSGIRPAIHRFLLPRR